jgi:uncharacterized protein (DUF433 family)
LGVYAPDQAAGLLGIRADMVTRWLYGDRLGQAALFPQYPAHQGRLLTFVDLIQEMAIRDIRDKEHVSLQKIRATVEAAKRHGVAYPFARKHTTYVFTDDIVLRLNDGRLIQITGKYLDQDLMEPVVQGYLSDIGYDDQGCANSYVPLSKGFRHVILSPTINYGAPTVMPGMYTVETLLNATLAEGSVPDAARICDVNEEDVRLALEYEKSLRRAA